MPIQVRAFLVVVILGLLVLGNWPKADPPPEEEIADIRPRGTIKGSDIIDPIVDVVKTSWKWEGWQEARRAVLEKLGKDEDEVEWTKGDETFVMPESKALGPADIPGSYVVSGQVRFGKIIKDFKATFACSLNPIDGRFTLASLTMKNGKPAPPPAPEEPQ
jgi:hypothetical protein